ncbi:response regulator [Geodermatophilus sp. SYSU D00710]
MRLLLCDDHRLFAEAMATALESRGHQVVVTTSLAEALHAVDEEEPDVCLVDLRFPDGGGAHVVAALRAGRPSRRIVVLSGSGGADDVAASIAAGAVGFLDKAQPVTEVFSALDRVAAGEPLPRPPRPFPDASPDRASPDEAPANGVGVRRLLDVLTPREREVLDLMVAAEDTAGIARALRVAPSTARTHLQNVMLKLGVHSRLEAVALVAGVSAREG